MASEAYLTWREALSGRMRRLTPFVQRPRLVGGGLLFLVLVIVAIMLVPSLSLSRSAAKATVVARLETLIGQNVSIDGPIRFSLLPRTRLVVERVRIGRGNGFDIDQIVADLDPLDALWGHARLSRLVLIRPALRPDSAMRDIALADPDAKGLAWLREAVGNGLGRMNGLQILEIRDGVYRPAVSDTGGPSGFSNANLTVTQSSQGAAINLSGSFIWNGQPTDLDMKVASPAALIAGKESGIDFHMQAPPLEAGFSGTASLMENTGVTGHIKLSSSSFSRGLEWIGNPKGRVPDLGAVAIDGDLLLRGRSANLANVALTIAGSTGRGALEAKLTDTAPVVAGTLAFEQLDLDPFGRSIAPLPKDPIDMERPLDMSFADAVNLDIRLSAGKASLGQIPLSDVAAVVTLGDGTAKIDVGDAAVFGGRGQAVLNLDGRGMHPLVSGKAALTDIDTAQMFQTLSANSLTVSGKSNITATVEAPAKDWASIIRDIDGDARIKVRDGAVAGFDPQVFAKPGARRLMDGSIGATVPFDQLNAQVSMRGARLRLREVTIANDTGVLTAKGDYYAQTNSLSIRGTYDANPPKTASATGEFTAAKPVRFTMHGQWPDPDVETEASDDTR